MKYPKITFGQVEAVWNKLGGEEGIKNFLSGKTHVVEKPQELKGLPLTIHLDHGVKLETTNGKIECPASNGKEIFFTLDGRIRKNGDFGELYRESSPKKAASMTVYELKKEKGGVVPPLTTVFYHLFDLVKGDLGKLAVNIDQFEYVVLNNMDLITEVQSGHNFFLVDVDRIVFPISVRTQAGGHGKVFDAQLHSLGELMSYGQHFRLQLFLPRFIK